MMSLENVRKYGVQRLLAQKFVYFHTMRHVMDDARVELIQLLLALLKSQCDRSRVIKLQPNKSESCSDARQNRNF